MVVIFQFPDITIYFAHFSMSSSEWLKNQHRDTFASHLGHYDQLSYFAVAQNDSIGRIKYEMLQVSDVMFYTENQALNQF